MKTLEFNSSTYIPSIHFEGIYDVNAKFAGFKVKGTGPFKGNASESANEFSLSISPTVFSIDEPSNCFRMISTKF